MTFAEAAMIMMSGGGSNIQPLTVTENKEYNAADYGCDGFNPVLVNIPESSGGIWDILDAGEIELLATIALAPNTEAHIYDIGKYFKGEINKDLDGDIPYLQSIGYRSAASLVITYKGKPIYYSAPSASGDMDVDMFLSNGYCYSNRRIKLGATNIKQYGLSKSRYMCNFNCTMEYYLDYLIYNQAEYEDGTHWEEQYAYHSSISKSYFSWTFYGDYPTYTFDNNVRGSTIYEQYDNICNVGNDVCNRPDGFPILNYIKPEDHFSNSYYINEDAINRGYYNSNVAYMEKWGKPELWV